MREYAKSVFPCLRSNFDCSCTASHMFSLQLEVSLDDDSSGKENEQISKIPQFEVMLSYSPDKKTRLPKDWQMEPAEIRAPQNQNISKRLSVTTAPVLDTRGVCLQEAPETVSSNQNFDSKRIRNLCEVSDNWVVCIGSEIHRRLA